MEIKYNQTETECYLSQILSNTQNSIILIDGIFLSKGNDKKKNQYFVFMKGKLQSVINDIRRQLPPAMVKIINEQIVKNWDIMAYQEVANNMQKMNNEQIILLEKVSKAILEKDFEFKE